MKPHESGCHSPRSTTASQQKYNKNGKYWAITGPKLYEPPEDQDYRRIVVFSTLLVNGGSYTFTPPYTPSWRVQGQPYLVIGTLVHVFLIEGAGE
jgi:hypothetical protein